MPEYRFKGTLVLGGVTFYISAPNPEIARTQARKGKYDEYDADFCEAVDCDIQPSTLEDNT